MADTKSLAHIAIDLLPDGRARVVSTCAGRPDSAYSPLPDGQLGAEVQALVVELRERLSLSKGG